MKTGHLMVIGLVASIWSGTGDYDDLTFTTVWEDSKHGGNMQASLLFMNLHSKCVQTNSVPESIIISADNTVKETKNGIFFVSWSGYLLLYSIRACGVCARAISSWGTPIPIAIEHFHV